MDENKIYDLPSHQSLVNLTSFQFPKGFKKGTYLIYPICKTVVTVSKFGLKIQNISLLNCFSTRYNQNSITGSQDMKVHEHVRHKIILHSHFPRIFQWKKQR
jgi:hypothetical protein